MKRSIMVTALMLGIMLLGATVYSCNEADGLVWMGPDYPAGGIPEGKWVDNHALALTDDPGFGVIVMSEGGESLVLHTVLDADRKIADVEGTVWIGPNGDTLVTRFDANGWPKHAIIGTDVYFFGNWTSTTVDVVRVHSNGSYEILDDVDRSAAALLFPISKPGQPLELIGFNTEKEDVLLEELPSLGVRNYGSTFNLSPYGRAMQAYQYSSGFSIVPKRLFTDSSNPQNWVIWGLVGTEIGACSVNIQRSIAGPELPCGSPFVPDATAAMMNTRTKPFYVAVSTGMGFGSMAPLSTSVEAYNTAKSATAEAKVLYVQAYVYGKEISDWIPYYFQGKTF